jgi:hypothetical protein
LAGNIVNISPLPKHMHSSNATPIKISAENFIEIGKFVLQFVQEYKSHRIVKPVFKIRIKWNKDLLNFTI